LSAPIVSALVAQAILAVYLQAVEWIDLAPWNDVRLGKEQRTIDIGIALAQAGLIAGTALRAHWVLLLAAAAYAGWLAAQVDGWWRPYLFGASERGVAFYDAHFGSTWKFLPRRAHDRPPPDANHVVLQVLIAAALITCCVAFAFDT
jgi:hypothetical protein